MARKRWRRIGAVHERRGDLGPRRDAQGEAAVEEATRVRWWTCQRPLGDRAVVAEVHHGPHDLARASSSTLSRWPSATRRRGPRRDEQP